MDAKMLMQGAAAPVQSGAVRPAGATVVSSDSREGDWAAAMDEVRALPHSHDEWCEDERPPTQRVADLALAIMERLRPLIAPPPESGSSGGGDLVLCWLLGGEGYFNVTLVDDIVVYGGCSPRGVFFGGDCASEDANEAARLVEQAVLAHADGALAGLMREKKRSMAAAL